MPGRGAVGAPPTRLVRAERLGTRLAVKIQPSPVALAASQPTGQLEATRVATTALVAPTMAGTQLETAVLTLVGTAPTLLGVDVRRAPATARAVGPPATVRVPGAGRTPASGAGVAPLEVRRVGPACRARRRPTTPPEAAGTAPKPPPEVARPARRAAREATTSTTVGTTAPTAKNGPAHGPPSLAALAEGPRHVARAGQPTIGRVEPVRLEFRVAPLVGPAPAWVEGLAAIAAATTTIALAGPGVGPLVTSGVSVP